MATREEYERRLLVTVTKSLSPREAVEHLAREVAAALAELTPEQTDPANEVWPADCVGCGHLVGNHMSVSGCAFPGCNCPRTPELAKQPATPPAPATTGGMNEAMALLLSEMRIGITCSTGAQILAAERVDQRAAVEAACVPLRERIASLEAELSEARKPLSEEERGEVYKQWERRGSSSDRESFDQAIEMGAEAQRARATRQPQGGKPETPVAVEAQRAKGGGK